MLRRVIVFVSSLAVVVGLFGILGATTAHGSTESSSAGVGIVLNPGIAVVLGVGALCVVAAYLIFAARGAFLRTGSTSAR